MTIASQVTYDDFAKIDLRCGKVIKVEPFTRAIKPAFKVWADFGPEIGTKQTSAQVTVHYTPESLLGKLVVGVVNIGSRNIGGFTSEFLMVGFKDAKGAISLVTPDFEAPLGERLC